MTEQKKGTFEFAYTSQLEKILGVKKLEDYPGGIRAGIKKFYEETVTLSGLGNHSFGHLLQAAVGQGFSHIPGSVLKEGIDSVNLSPMNVALASSERIDFLTDATKYLLDRLEMMEVILNGVRSSLGDPSLTPDEVVAKLRDRDIDWAAIAPTPSVVAPKRESVSSLLKRISGTIELDEASTELAKSFSEPPPGWSTPKGSTEAVGNDNLSPLAEKFEEIAKSKELADGQEAEQGKQE